MLMCRAMPSPLGDALGLPDGTSRAHETTQMASHAFVPVDTGAAGDDVEFNGLMAAIHARGVTTAAADAGVAVNHRIDHRLTVQLVGGHKVGQLLANKLVERGHPMRCHVVLHAQHQVVDDAIAILHDRCAHLYVAAAQHDELQRIVPGLNASYAAELHLVVHEGITG